MTDDLSPHVIALRSFNRSFTRHIGVLDDSFLGLGRPLAEARLLFEIGTEGADLRELRAQLGLDSGYLSRLLTSLADDDLVELRRDPHDGRRRRVELTASGRRLWNELDDRSEELATGLLTPLTERQRARLTDALDTADRLLRAATVNFETVDPQSDEATASMTAYFDELAERFPSGFDPGDTLTADADALRSPTGVFVIARADSEVVACGGVQRFDKSTGEIKRMWVAPAWRGVGLGSRMIAHLETEVRSLGHRRVVLDTNATLVEAVAMYERAGYTPIERYNDNPYAQRWFAKDLASPK